MFRSWLIPPYVPKTRPLEALLPRLYLKGISSGEMGEVLEVVLGRKPKDFPLGVMSRPKAEWETECDKWMVRDLSKERWV